MLFCNGKPHCVFSQLLFYCQVFARKTICLLVLPVYLCQNKEQNHVTVSDTLPMWYLADVKNKPVILRHLVNMWFSYSPRAQPEVNKSHIPSLPRNNLYIHHALRKNIPSACRSPLPHPTFRQRNTHPLVGILPQFGIVKVIPQK